MADQDYNETGVRSDLKEYRMKLPDIPHDKAVHFIYGVVIGLICMFASAWLFGFPELQAKLTALIGAGAFGFAKEGIDVLLNKRAVKAGKEVPHTVDMMDAVATTIGGLVILVA